MDLGNQKKNKLINFYHLLPNNPPVYNGIMKTVEVLNRNNVPGF